jgi:hypothetical protein
MKFGAFWDVAPCSFVGVDVAWSRSTPTRLDGSTSLKAPIFMYMFTFPVNGIIYVRAY